MTKLGVSISPCLYEVFNKQAEKTLTIEEIAKQFVELLDKAINENDVKAILYRQLIRLCRNDIIIKEKVQNSKTPRYRANAQFKQTKFRFKPTQYEPAIPAQTQGTSQKNKHQPTADNYHILQSLKSELTQNENKLKLSQAEENEYKRLCTVIPALKNELHQCQLITQKRTTELMGKMAAVKNVLQTYQSHQ